MKLAIMQPYLFPYIGYFQLIGAADTFIIYDDVNYINRGWINRNRLLINGSDQLFTLQLQKASQNKLINEITVGGNRDQLVRTIEQAYKKAPFFDGVFPVLASIIQSEEPNLARFIGHSIEEISRSLGLQTAIVYSSAIPKNTLLKAQAKILDICERMKADTYINPINGRELYEKDAFRERHIDLYFLKTGTIQYSQFDNVFVPMLSIVDVMMFNPTADIAAMLTTYELI